MAPASDAVPVGTLPPVGEIPSRMFAQLVRQDRFGDPRTAFQVEEVDTPAPGPREVLIAVMASGINFNNVWAARGTPVDVIAQRQRGGDPNDFHLGGSDASGIVYAVGEGVERVAVGDEVIVHPGWWKDDDPWIVAGKDPIIAPSARIWGYDHDRNFGSFGQFAVAQEHQVLPKADHLTWEAAAAPTLVGTTAQRMLFGWAGNTVMKDDVVLVWGGSGGLGTQAIQLVKQAGGIAVAVVSSADKGEYCVGLGAEGYIDRTEFDHWGIPPHWTDGPGQKEWTGAARAFGGKLWEIVGKGRNPAIVFEHPGEDTIPTSIFVCEPGGMVVVCAGTTGYSAMVDLRYHWVRQKRLQGSHGTNDEQAIAYNDLVRAGAIDPCLGQVSAFDEIGEVHGQMAEGKLSFGNAAILIGAPTTGLGVSDS
ncbi:crotonyl-CoA carboxylase/reductase [Gaiella sp.]|uniref:crotonyl-CoA carboxylase/reductase n=1 Tax=Gaiella sp. TaxID=2663207 RepID=UPI0032640C47